MRAMMIAAGCAALAACGGPETSQANNTQANISNDSRPPATAKASVVVPASMAPVTGGEVKAIMHERHEGMEAIGKANKAIRDQLQKDSPDPGVIRTNAAKIASLAQKASGWFHAGTGPEAGHTGAKAAIWQNPQDFSARLRDFQTAAQAFQAATNGNVQKLVNGRLHDLGRTCNACHQKYRMDMHHAGLIPT